MPYQLRRWGGVHNERVDRKAILALKILLLVAVPTVLTSTVFASIYAWVQGRQYSYTPEDWQRCLVAPNKGGVGADDKTLFTGGAATFAMKAVVFLILSFNGVNAGLLDHDMLPYGIFVSFAAILGMTVYRESSPVQPTPKLMSVTLVTLTKFIHPHMYANLPPYQGPPSSELCHKAFRFNQAFLVLQYMMLVLAVGLFATAVFTCVYSPRDYLDVRLEGNRPALFLVPVTMAGYVLTLLAKEIVAVDTIEVLQQTKLDYMFMFKKADMDIISMTMMVTSGSVLVGTFHECRNKFRLAAFMAFLHVLISFPVMVGTYAGYNHLTYPYKGDTYDLWQLSQCKAYINAKNFGIFSDYPGELTEICRQVQLSLVGQTIIFVAMFLQMLCCGHVVYANDSPVRPPHETRCMSCAYRNEGEGMLSFIRQPTILGSLSMYQRPSLGTLNLNDTTTTMPLPRSGKSGNGYHGGGAFSPPSAHEPLLRPSAHYHHDEENDAESPLLYRPQHHHDDAAKLAHDLARGVGYGSDDDDGDDDHNENGHAGNGRHH